MKISLMKIHKYKLKVNKNNSKIDSKDLQEILEDKIIKLMMNKKMTILNDFIMHFKF
jgi:hypothetical protein